MPIVFFNRFYAPDHSATAQILTDIAEHLAANGHEVAVITSRAIYGRDKGLLPRAEQRGGVSIVRTWTPARRIGMPGRIAAYLAYYVTSFAWALRFANRDTVLIVKTDPPLLSIPLAIAALLKRARAVHWVQDLYPEIALAYGMRGFAGPVASAMRTLRNWAFRRSSHIVAIGDVMAKRVAASGVRADRIATIPNWSDDEAITPSAARSPALRKEWNIAPNSFVLEYSGNLGRAHEYDTLLGAALLLNERADIIFLFVGGGHMADRLSEQVANLGLKSFRFVPYQPRTRLSDSLGVGDAHWISLRSAFEGLIVPSKVFGICAAGRPLIAVCMKDGELPRMLKADRDCIVVSPGDSTALATAIINLAADPAAANQMGEAARNRLDSNYRKVHAFARWQAMLDDLTPTGATQHRMPPRQPAP